MSANQFQRVLRERFAWLDARPRRCPRWMRKRDDVDALLAPRDLIHFSNLLDQGSRRHELLDGHTTHRNDQPRAQELELALQPRLTVLHFFRTRDAIAAVWVFSGKTAAHGGDVHARPKRGFVDTEWQKPFEQLFARRPREGPSERRLFVAGGLPDEQHLRRDRAAHDRRPNHLGAAAAGAQRALVLSNELEALRSHARSIARAARNATPSSRAPIATDEADTTIFEPTEAPLGTISDLLIRAELAEIEGHQRSRIKELEPRLKRWLSQKRANRARTQKSPPIFAPEGFREEMIFRERLHPFVASVCVNRRMGKYGRGECPARQHAECSEDTFDARIGAQRE